MAFHKAYWGTPRQGMAGWGKKVKNFQVIPLWACGSKRLSGLRKQREEGRRSPTE